MDRIRYKQRQQFVEFLSWIPFFGQYSRLFLSKNLSIFKQTSYIKNQTLLNELDPIKRILIVLEGEIEAS